MAVVVVAAVRVGVVRAWGLDQCYAWGGGAAVSVPVARAGAGALLLCVGGAALFDREGPAMVVGVRLVDGDEAHSCCGWESWILAGRCGGARVTGGVFGAL